MFYPPQFQMPNFPHQQLVSISQRPPTLESVSETQPQDIVEPSSWNVKKRSHMKKIDAEKEKAADQVVHPWTNDKEVVLTKSWIHVFLRTRF
ncbi:hypothetical protein HanPI659440_Chr04g0178061 [Helianthus annuus]|nr:hypothetical protein HanPI659440_Chr04g0178061 [Helianthus annuus]